MIERRAFVAGSLCLLGASLAAGAQPAGRAYRIGMLQNAPAALNTANLDAFRRGLRELGYVEGQNVVIEYRSADGRDERFANLATELVRLNVDLIVTRGTPAALAAKNATGTIPVVMAGIGDPVGQGVVASLARPGGNITGLSGLNTEIYGKRVELLRELLPGATRVAAIFNMSNASHPPQWKELELAARSLRVQPQLFDVRRSDDLPRAFDAAVRQRADALVVGLDGVTQANRQTVVDLAARHRLAAIYASREEFVDVGGLISYGVSFPHLHYRAASFVDRLLKGAKPADLPIEQPTKFELVINLRTAKALGLTIPPAVLARADAVIE
jgi:putative ABC transport system substrate-binding protein